MRDQRPPTWLARLAVLVVLESYYGFLTLLSVRIPFDFPVLGEPRFMGDRFAAGLVLAAAGGLPLVAAARSRPMPSTLFFAFQLAFVYLPACALCAVHADLPLSFLALIGLVLLGMGLALNPLRHWKRMSLPVWGRLMLAAPLVLWVVYATGVFLFAVGDGRLSLRSVFDLSTLYSFRQAVFLLFQGRELTAFSALGYFVIPFLTVAAVEKRRWIFLPALAAVATLLFGVTGMKSYLAMPFFAAAVYGAVTRMHAARFTATLLVSIVGLILAAEWLGRELDSPGPVAVVWWRGVMTPGELHLLYGRTFAHSPRLPVWQLFATNYPDGREMNTAEVIAADVFGGTIGRGEGANAGMIATAFARYGLVGVGAHSVALVLLLGLLDRSVRRGARGWIAYSSIPALFLLTNVDFVGVSLYYGFGFSVLLTAAACGQPPHQIAGSCGSMTHSAPGPTPPAVTGPPIR